MIRSANPALGDRFLAERDLAGARTSAGAMTLGGTVNKTAMLLVMIVLAASYTWRMTLDAETPGQAAPWMIGGLVGGLVFAMITIFRKTWAGITAPLYAICSGLMLGGISAMFESRFPGIAMQAVGLTFGVLFSLLLVYRLGIIKATENFKLMVVSATGGIFILYMVSFVMSFFGASIPFIHSSGLLGIGFSLFVVCIAALNLVLDFDFIENGAEQGLPKYMEWYGAFGLVVTLVWLYIEILHLLAKLQSRD
jgi:uncharacterized YccA/Bax inhibitor family protein